jgi:heat shock protein beta
MNDQPAIWTRSKSEVTDEEYVRFFKGLRNSDDQDPLTWIHFRAEGEIEFKSILFIPKAPPSDMYDNYYGKQSQMRLYVRKVLITDEFEDLMPRYLSFIRGVVDSDDLPLNVSRETLQQHKVLRVMGKKLTRKALEMLRKLSQKHQKDQEADEADEESAAEATEGDEAAETAETAEEKKDPYIEFWEAFGKNIKLGLIEDSSNRTKLSKLLRFKTSMDGGEKWSSLEDYVGRMKEWQKSIYYISGKDMEEVKSSAFMERLQAKGLEVVFLTDPIDEYAIQNLTEFDGKKLQSVTKEGLKFGDEEEVDTKRAELYKDQFKPLTKWMKDKYGDKVEKIQVSARLDSTPCIFVTSQYGYSANMERIMHSQAFADNKRTSYLVSKKTMEINPRHPIVVELLKRTTESPDDESTTDLAWLLHDTALLNSGLPVSDAKAFSKRMYRTLQQGLSLDSLDLVPEIEVPEEPEPVEEEDDTEEAVVEEEEEAAEEEEKKEL